jgi:hypothetical protein
MTMTSGGNQAIGNWTTLSETMQADKHLKDTAAVGDHIQKWAEVLRCPGQSSEMSALGTSRRVSSGLVVPALVGGRDYKSNAIGSL